jgi:hypothetical protein
MAERSDTDDLRGEIIELVFEALYEFWDLEKNPPEMKP